MAKSALHPRVEARPSPLKGTFKKAFCALFTFCAVFLLRTRNVILSQITRKQPVIYPTNDSHNVSRKQLETAAELTFTDATTREKLPEVSPKGPGSTHLRALAGQRSNITERTLVTQGLASRSLKSENKQPSTENTTSDKQQLTTPPLSYMTYKN